MFYTNGFGWQFGPTTETPFYRAKSVVECFLQTLHLPGDVAEFGLYQGHTMAELFRYLLTVDCPKTLMGCDWFKGLHPSSQDGAETAQELSAKAGTHNLVDGVSCVGDQEALLQYLNALKNQKPESPAQAELVVGDVCKLKLDPARRFCFVYSDLDLYEPTRASLKLAREHLVPGGCLVVDDYGADKWWPGVRMAVDELDWTGWAVERDGRETVWQFKAWRLI